MTQNQYESGLSRTAVLELGLTLVVGVVATIGNVLIILAVYRNKKLRTPTNLLLLNLAVADLLTGLFCAPLTASAIVGNRWLAGSALCQVQGFLLYVFGAVSIHTVTVTSLNRYCRVVRPNVYRKWVTYRSTVIILLLMWVLLTCGYLIVLVSGSTEILYQSHTSSCGMRFSQSLRGRAALGLTIVFSFLYPIVTMTVCYFKVFLKIRQHNSQTVSVLQRKSNSLSLGKRRHSTPKPKHRGFCWPRLKLFPTDNTAKYNFGERIQEGNNEINAWTICENTAHITIENTPREQRSKLFAEDEIADNRDNEHEFTPQTLDSRIITLAPIDKGEHSRTRNSISGSTDCQRSHEEGKGKEKITSGSKKMAKKTSKTRAQRASSFGSNVEEIQITRILFAVLIGFVLCWVPPFMIAFLSYLSLARSVPYFVRFLSVWFVYLSSSLNVFIYGVMSRPFRRNIINIICCRR